MAAKCGVVYDYFKYNIIDVYGHFLFCNRIYRYESKSLLDFFNEK
jgi:hypothetical protein